MFIRMTLKRFLNTVGATCARNESRITKLSKNITFIKIIILDMHKLCYGFFYDNRRLLLLNTNVFLFNTLERFKK